MSAAAARPASPPQAAAHPGSVVAEGFSFWYGAKQALHEIDLTIPPRAVTALIGPSGCGKSTLLRLIAGLIRPSAGEVAFPGSARPRGGEIAFVFQDATLMP